MNITHIVIGVAVALLGIGIMLISHGFEKLAKSGQIPAERLIYFSMPSGSKYPLLSAMGIFTLVPGLLLVVVGVLEASSSA